VIARLANTKTQLESALWRFSNRTKAVGYCDAADKTGQTGPECDESDEGSTSTAVPMKVLQ